MRLRYQALAVHLEEPKAGAQGQGHCLALAVCCRENLQAHPALEEPKAETQGHCWVLAGYPSQALQGQRKLPKIQAQHDALVALLREGLRRAGALTLAESQTPVWAQGHASAAESGECQQAARVAESSA